MTPKEWSCVNTAHVAVNTGFIGKPGNPMARASTRQPSQQVSPSNLRRPNPIVFLRETVSELKKAVWPSKEETARLTAIVIVLAIAVGLFLGALDRIFDFSFAQVIFRRF